MTTPTVPQPPPGEPPNVTPPAPTSPPPASTPGPQHHTPPTITAPKSNATHPHIGKAGSDSTCRPMDAGAVASLGVGVAGIVAALWAAALVPVLAVILGHKTLRGMHRSKGATRGEGLAIAGLILGYLGLILSMLVWLATH